MNIDRTGAFVTSLPGVNRINILPYHRAATAKYDNLRLKLYTNNIEPSSHEWIESVAARLENYGSTVKKCENFFTINMKFMPDIRESVGEGTASIISITR